jgi:hypothetical protein
LLPSIARSFASKPTSSTILRNYKFLSQSISRLKEELERHQKEWEVNYDHLFDNQSFQTRIHPIVDEHRQRQALICQGFHPYSRISVPPNISSANNPPSIVKRIQGRASVEIHDQRNVHGSQGSYYTALDNTPGSMRSRIITLDDEEKDCEGCGGDHKFRSCARDTRGEDEEYTPDEPHSL